MRFPFFISISLLLLIPLSSFADNVCKINDGPTPLFADYIKTTQSKVAQIRTFIQKNNTCKGTTGSFTQERRFFDTIDMVDNTTSGYSDLGSYTHLLTDFAYNVKLVYDGGDKKAVTEQGKLIQNIETNTIIPAIQSATNACALDISMNINGIAGNTPGNALSKLLANNKKLEAYYKNVALGFPNSSETDPTLVPIFQEIQQNYSPEVTASCNSTSGYEELSTKFMKSWEKMTTGIDASNQNWKDAIALFRGENTQSADYFALQKRLFAGELARQGVTKNAADIMMGVLTCVQQKSGQNADIMGTIDARTSCDNTWVSGFSNIVAGFSKTYRQAQNTDTYIAGLITYQNELSKVTTSMTDMWGQINQILMDNNTSTDTQTVTNLVNLHTNLVTTNANLKKEITRIQADCQKAQPSIRCPK